MYGLSEYDLKPGMETDSIKSALSEPGVKSKRSKSHSNHRSTHRSHSHKSSRSNRNQNTEDNMAPFQTAVTVDETRNGQEVVEVQILPQDENWGENTTAITGNTSDQSGSIEEVSLWPNDTETGISFPCSRYVGVAIASIFCIIAFVSPVLMLILPKIGFFPSLGASLSAAEKAELLSCGAECKGLLVSVCFKLALLAGGTWAIFIRRARATMPSIFMFRAIVLLLILICCFTYWLFYIVQITEGARESVTGEESLEYRSLVAYAGSLTDTLLFIHYLAVILIELRHIQPTYYIKVIRSPDGESRSYAIGQLSIQRAAVWLLDKYYTEFPVYNPYLERLPVSKSRKPTSSFKFYDVDGMNNCSLQSQSRNGLRESKRRDSSHNERFYEEHDYERRVKKRRARLITAAEEAFTHIKRLHHEPGNVNTGMDSQEASQAVFPSLARALQKYLRVTRQQPRHSVDSILKHLSTCLANDLSPRAFLERFLLPSPVLQDPSHVFGMVQGEWILKKLTTHASPAVVRNRKSLKNEKEQKEVQSWSLICDELLTRPLRSGVMFQLRQSDVSLFCSVQALPHYNISEEVIDPLTNRFVIRLNSETSV